MGRRGRRERGRGGKGVREGEGGEKREYKLSSPGWALTSVLLPQVFWIIDLCHKDWLNLFGFLLLLLFCFVLGFNVFVNLIISNSLFVLSMVNFRSVTYF